MLSSFWCAVLQGRNQLFETMKRGGADTLENVVKPQGSDVAHHPITDPGQGRRWDQFSRCKIQKGQDFGNGGVSVKCFFTCASDRMVADLITASFRAILLSPLPSSEIIPGACFGSWSARRLPTCCWFKCNSDVPIS